MALSKVSADRLRDEAYEERMAVAGLRVVQCETCGVTDAIYNLHHVVYEEDSVLPDKGGQHQTVKRRRECIAYPERFRLLCRNCHRAIEPIIHRLVEIDDMAACDAILAMGDHTSLLYVAALTARNKAV